MEKVKKTYKEFFEFLKAAQIALESYEDSPKFSYALTRVVKANDAIRSEYAELIEDLKIDNALEKDGKIQTRHENGVEIYDMSKEGKKNLRKAIKELNDQVKEFNCFITNHYPKNLDFYTASFLSGFVLSPETIEELEKNYLSSIEESANNLAVQTEGE